MGELRGRRAGVGFTLGLPGDKWRALSDGLAPATGAPLDRGPPGLDGVPKADARLYDFREVRSGTCWFPLFPRATLRAETVLNLQSIVAAFIAA